MADKVILGYWGIRAAGQVSRLLLAYTGAVWEDVKYNQQEQWFGKDKKELGFDFPNLPYLIEGDFKISESRAVSLYIITRSDKKDLLGKTNKEQAVVEQLIGVYNDTNKPVGQLFWDKDWEQNLPKTIEKITPKLDNLSKFVGEKDFAIGYLTLADFYLQEFSFYLEKIAPETYSKYGFLARIRKNFENLPEIKKYYEQENSFKGPFFPPKLPVVEF